MMTGKKHKSGYRFWIIISCLFFIPMLFIISAARLIPAKIRQTIEQRLAEICEGPVIVDNAELSFSGNLFLDGIKFYDKNKNEWLSLENIKVKLSNYLSLNPVITEIEIETLQFEVSVSDGNLSLPLVLKSQKSIKSDNKPEIPFQIHSDNIVGLQNKYINLKKLQIQNASVSLVEKPESKVVCDYLCMQYTEFGDFYDTTLILSKQSEQDISKAFIRGFVNPVSREISLSMDINYNVTKQGTNLVFAALGTPSVSMEGKLIADVTVTGFLNDLWGLHSNGKIEFDNCSIFINDKIFANSLSTTARLDEQNINFEEISAEVYNGPVIGSVYIHMEQHKPIEIDGRFSGENISFTEFTSLLSGQDKTASKGSVALNYNFKADGHNIQDLSAEGQIFLNDADITVIPVIPHIFNTLGLSKIDPVKLSDAECTFNMAGPVVTIQSAHIANTVGAIEIEQGGTIDLQTGQLDMYVIAVPLRQLYDFAKKAPVADIVFNLREKLARFYVRGHWSSPPAKLITKTPIKDIKEGTVGFFQDVARNGGDFGQEMIKGFKALLSIGQPKKESSDD